MDTEILKIEDLQQDIKKIKYAASLAEQGHLVVFPTETVYGIAAKVDKETLSNLDALKSRDQSKRYTLHIGNVDQLSKYVPGMGLRAKKLAEKSFPGPVTIVFEFSPEQIELLKQTLGEEAVSLLYAENSLGVRCPDNSVASEFLSMIDAPVVGTSANLGGQVPAVDAQAAFDQLDGHVCAILDAGPCTEKVNSTVAKISTNGIEILREGAVSRDQIVADATVNIVFVCSGNTCRSPMAAAFCKQALAEKLNCNIDQLDQFGYKVSSAGVMAYIDEPASQHTLEVCAEQNLDLSQHRSSGLTEDVIRDSDIIFVMGMGHMQRILDFYPEVEDKCRFLAKDRDIVDPFGGNREVYESCASEIKKALDDRLGELSL